MIRSSVRSARVAALLALSPAVLHAQVPGDVVRLRALPEAGTRAPRSEWVGTLERLDADSLVLRVGTERHALARGIVQHVWVRRQARSATAGALRWGIPGAALGTLMGAALGALGTGEELCNGAPSSGGCSGGNGGRLVAQSAALIGVGFGIGGAALGATYGRYGWRSADAGRGAMLYVTPTRVAIAIPLR